MAFENVLEFVRALSESVVLVSGAGEVLAFSQKAAMTLNLDKRESPPSLQELVVAPPSSVTNFLHSCLRTSETVLWTFSLRSGHARCRFEGSRNKAGAEHPLVWLRLTPLEQANSRFQLLNERISQLSKEVHARTRVELALRERTAQFETLLNEAPLGVYLIDSDFRVQQANPTAQQFFGLPDIIGIDFEVILRLLWPKHHADQMVQQFRQTLATGEASAVAEYDELRLDREKRECHEWQVNRIPISENQNGLVCYFRDISARKQSEAALRKSEKLAATGRLASSIAHEINNPLEGVTNLLYLARQDSNLGFETRQYLQMAEQELARVAHIAKQTLGFYRETSSPIWFNVTEVSDSVLSMYEHRMKSRGVQINKDFRKTPPICALTGEFKQVLSNLIINALDAMPKEDARLFVRVSHSRDWSGTEAEGIRVSVADNGSGIHASALSKIFEAFFTTKAATGTGLGLWLSREIVHKHGGRIHVRSRANALRTGTIFSVFWPCRQDTSVLLSENHGKRPLF
jgi:PAS domain S-box-containing protein